MTKTELRKTYLELRKTLSNDEVLSFSNLIFKHFIEAFDPKELKKVHLFQSISKFNEVDTQPFIAFLQANGTRLFVPKMIGSQLISVELTPRTPMALNSWGILEPTSSEDSGEKNFDAVLTPLLYCDALGNRVGYGKGFYDGFFNSISPETKKIGVGFFDPAEGVDNVFESDVRLDYLVTPRAVLSFIGNL